MDQSIIYLITGATLAGLYAGYSDWDYGNEPGNVMITVGIFLFWPFMTPAIASFFIARFITKFRKGY